MVPSKNEPRILEALMAIDEWFPEAQVIVANDRYGKGKGWAIREALGHADHEVIVLLDGDMDIHPRMIWRLLPFVADYDVVVGRKQVRGLLSRRILTHLSRIYIRLMFRLGVDTQTGLKIFHRKAMFPWVTDSFAFDIEVLDKARRAGYQIIEVPVEANIEKRMKFSSIWKCFVESVKIFIRSLR